MRSNETPAGVVIVLAIGMGGYVAWPILSARLAERGDPVEPVVVMPAIPAELLPQMTTLAGAAFANAFRDARAGAGGVPMPSQDWLAGVYLANATQFGDVETFWLGARDVLAGLRAIAGQTFHANYERSMAAAGVSAENGALLLERADSGFVAAAGRRHETYALVDELIDAALGLHDFLIANEQNIEYTPASTITSDPVLEAKPSTPEIRQAMEDRIDRVTEALDELDYLSLVTAEGLWAAVLTRVQEVGIQ